MKKLLLFGMFIFAVASASAQFTFQETIGGPLTDVPNTISMTSDSGFFIVGYSQKFSYAMQRKMLAMRLDKNGDTLWQRLLGGVNSDEGSCGIQVQGGFAAIGTTSSYNCWGADYGMFLSILDSAGNFVTGAGYCNQNNHTPTDMLELSDGSLVILGFVETPGNITTRDIFLMKVDSPYNYTVWMKRYTMAGSDYGYSLEATADGGFIIAGETQGRPDQPGILIKTDALGNIQWRKAIPTFGWLGINIQPFTCKQTLDRGYIVAGEIWDFQASNMELFLFKLDSTGAPVWSESIRPASVDSNCSVYATSIEVLNDGGYILSSIFQAPGYMDDNYVVRTDSTGSVLWSRRFGGANNEGVGPPNNSVTQYTSPARSCIAVCQPGNGSPLYFGLTSLTRSFIPAANQQDIYVVKISDDGTSGCNEIHENAIVTYRPLVLDTLIVSATNYQLSASSSAPGISAPNLPKTVMCTHLIGIEEESAPLFDVFPNPASQQLTIQIAGQESFNYLITNSLGEIVSRKNNNSELTVIDISPFPSGAYFLTISQPNGSSTRMFVKQ